MARPGSLAEVAALTLADRGDFADAHDGFLDAFYLDHPDKEGQQARIDEAPAIVGDRFVDAWIGAVGEHLALRWDLCVPEWTRRGDHFALTLPRFVPDTRSLRGTLLLMSPPAFRRRMLFTHVEPLKRARFPRGVERIRLSFG